MRYQPASFVAASWLLSTATARLADTASNHVQDFDRQLLVEVRRLYLLSLPGAPLAAGKDPLRPTRPTTAAWIGATGTCSPAPGCHRIVRATSPRATPCNRKGTVSAPNAKSDLPSSTSRHPPRKPPLGGPGQL